MSKAQTFRFEIPKLTFQAAPFRQSFMLWLPVVESLNVKIPKGHNGVAEMRIESPGFILLDGIKGDNQTKESGPLNIRLFGPPYYIDCVGWNSSNFLNHEFIIEVNEKE